MYRPRVIPVLLLKDGALVKTTKFSKDRYIGDPINAVRIFNGLKADEIVFLDITASKEYRAISLDLIKDVSEEANMPFSVGGGIKTIEQIAERIAVGAEKVILNSSLFENPDFIRNAVNTFGSSTLVACLDVKKNWLGKLGVYSYSGSKKQDGSVSEISKKIENLGLGEIIIQSIDNDGVMQGYDLQLIKEVSESVKIPVTALGGAGCMDDMLAVLTTTQVNGLAAGSMFVYHGERRGILVNYPEMKEINKLFGM